VEKVVPSVTMKYLTGKQKRQCPPIRYTNKGVNSNSGGGIVANNATETHVTDKRFIGNVYYEIARVFTPRRINVRTKMLNKTSWFFCDTHHWTKSNKTRRIKR